MTSDIPEATGFYLSETPRERDDRIRALFDSLDRRHQGFLDRDCIEKGLTAMTHLPARTKFVNELLAQCDTSQDGVVDYDEFKTYVHEKEEELWQLFQRMDTRGDGSLLPSDLAMALQEAGITITQEELMNFMQWMDLDGNGVIDFYEFKNFLLLLPETSVSEIYRYYETSTQLTQDAEVIIPPTDETSHHAIKYLLAGGLAGAVSRTCTAPFDRLKVYLITDSSKGGSLTLKEAIKAIYAKGGWRGFFVGNGLNIFKIVPESAIKFYSYETCKGLLAKALHCEDKDSIPTGARFLAGGMAGLSSQFFIYPVETLKTRIMSLQRESMKTITTTSTTTTSSSPLLSSFSLANGASRSVIFTTIKSMYTRAGLRAFWPGLTLGLVGVFPYQAMDLGIYETLKLGYLRHTDQENLHSDKQKQPSVFVLWACGMVSGSIGATSVYPLNVIRTRLQAQGTPAHPRYYSSPWDAAQVTFRTEGIRGFYKGLGPTLLKVVPAVSISYVTYEWSKNELGLA
ncbi:mitochondrial carrier domain-containing protein [Halteromyces radiatus]|uniref:mitochondrial carrier domain-containing protein n=1 Tax=Halteromyces radiatus TaxID=101107 RepID=UPI00222074AF|nr:mitochondrial carrier domain-containing protein [Halteromyces radiatus]KAI8081687.1 mitochondrial carrier domain-containing protein [Halteromyces radiatus]